ncbi:MAG TPA: hypothetical protein VNH21_03070 [Steroidobacteraceae bacterium]|nr:hypothetical protein [Steroidobacteraceae bacterium]
MYSDEAFAAIRNIPQPFQFDLEIGWFDGRRAFRVKCEDVVLETGFA